MFPERVIYCLVHDMKFFFYFSQIINRVIFCICPILDEVDSAFGHVAILVRWTLLMKVSLTTKETWHQLCVYFW